LGPIWVQLAALPVSLLPIVDRCPKIPLNCELTRMHGRAEKADLYVAGRVRQENAGWNLDSGLEVERDPCWGMVARVFLPTCPSVNTAVHQSV